MGKSTIIASYYLLFSRALHSKSWWVCRVPLFIFASNNLGNVVWLPSAMWFGLYTRLRKILNNSNSLDKVWFGWENMRLSFWFLMCSHQVFFPGLLCKNFQWPKNRLPPQECPRDEAALFCIWGPWLWCTDGTDRKTSEIQWKFVFVISPHLTHNSKFA